MEPAQTSRRNRVIGALILGFVAEIINKICPLITLSMAQSRLGLGSLGSALFGLSILEITLPLVTYGYTYFGALQLPRLADDRREQSRLLSQIMVLRLGHALFTAIGLLVATRMFATWQEHQGLLLKMLPFLFGSAIDMTYFNYGQQRIAHLFLWVGGFKLLNLIAVVLLVQGPGDADLFALLMLGANSAVSLASAFWILPRIGFSRVSWSECWRLLKHSSALALVVFLYPLYERFDILIVEQIQNPTVLGAYIAPWRLVMSVVPIFMVIATTFLSENIAAKNQAALDKGAHQALHLSLVLTIPIFVASPFVSADILALVFDRSLSASAHLFTIFTASILAEVFVCILGMQVLLLRRDLTWLACSMAAGIVLGALCSCGLQTQYGATGSAVGALCGRLLTVILICSRIPSVIGALPWREYWPVFLSAGVMALVLALMPENWPVLLRIALGGTIDLAVLASLLWWKVSPLLAIAQSRLLGSRVNK